MTKDRDNPIEYPLPGGRHGIDFNTVIYTRPSCPKCGSFDVSIVTTRPPMSGNSLRVRYHKCKDCEHSFKSVERITKGEQS